MSCSRLRGLALIALALVLGAGALPAHARAEALGDDGGAEWRLEQPLPPEAPVGVEGSNVPIGLGAIGDIEFWSPNRGVLITAGNGSTVPAGVWLYNGERWRELASVCGASDGRIAWAGPDEFWTISDGRPGQASGSEGQLPPLEDDTLCHFGVGPSGSLEVLASYATLAFQSSSYQPMHAAGCLSASDCWFAGEPLPAPQVGAFQLHWNGHSLAAEPYLPEGHAVRDERSFAGRLFQSVRLSTSDREIAHPLEPPALRAINPEGVSPSIEPVTGVPLYGSGEFPYALDFLHLGADADALWGAAGSVSEPPERSAAAHVTVVRYSKIQYSSQSGEYSEEAAPRWTQVLGPETSPDGAEAFPEDVVNAIAAEPASDSAWIALESEGEANSPPSSTALAQVARVSADGSVSDRLSLPLAGEPYGPKGAAARIVCPAAHDCWMTSTQGWLFHLSPAGERTLERDGDPAFSSESPITVRPADEGVPQVPSDALPVDDSGLEGERAAHEGAFAQPKAPSQFAVVAVALLSHVHSRLIHGSTLELRFHLAVKARVRLLAKRRSRVVAASPARTFAAGNRAIRLRLNVHRWPTKLDLQTHALAPLPTASTREAGVESVSTSLRFPRLATTLRSWLSP